METEGPKFKLIKPEFSVKVTVRNGEPESVNVITGNASIDSNPQASSGGKEVIHEVTALIRGISSNNKVKEEKP